ncbi:leucine-rich repeat-containing protein 34-like [Phthorimaea operculella]|nr:leucine-rich repeat-containing protein 34-like [Phthorimaea operculella]
MVLLTPQKPTIVTKPCPLKLRKRKCICNTNQILNSITGTPRRLKTSDVNKIRLGIFTEKNSDGTGNLVLRGKDFYERYQRRITDSDIRAIVLYVREAPRRITKLDLCYNQITDKGFYKLLKKLLVKGRSSVTNLNIMNNNLTEKSIGYLATYAPVLRLRYLRLNGNNFGTKGGEFLSEFLLKNTSVEFLDVGETDTTLSSVAKIITALRFDHGANKTVRVFDFSRVVPLFNRYSYETKWLAYHLEYLLKRNSSIIELHVQKNELIGHDMEYLVRGLRLNHTLLYLDLGYNRIGEYGIELIAKYLAEGQSQLILLNVAGNDIKDTGARALSFGLPFSKIRALDISRNKINDRGLLDLLNSIKKPYYLRFLNIWGNNINHITCTVIQRMLESEVLFQHTMDVFVYEVDERLYAAYYPNPADRNKHLYYCEMEFACAQPICHITRNIIPEYKPVKVDCTQRRKLDKTSKYTF